jgi:hypothetical protein
MWRVLRRIAKTYGRVRPDMAPGCPERLTDLEFLTYIWTFDTRIAPRIEAAIDKYDMRPRTVRLASDGAANEWIGSLTIDRQPPTR